MNNTTATNSSFTYHINKVENLHIDKVELATATHIYIDKVKYLHIGKIEIASPATTYEQPPTSPDKPSTQPTLTNSQLVLLFYYLLASLGIWLRLHVDLAPIARFMHLLTGKTYTSLRNSEYYKKLQRAPNLKGDRKLIKDLEVVKSLFLKVGLKGPAQLVDQELTLAHQDPLQPPLR